MIEILFATSNAGKAREVQAMFSDLDVDVKTLKEDGISVDVEENGNVEELLTQAEKQTDVILKSLFEDSIGDRELVIKHRN